MPLIDITLPKSAFSEEQKRILTEQATDLFLNIEGMGENPKTRRLTWVYLHPRSTDDCFSGGETERHHHYRIEITVCCDPLTDDGKAELTRSMTQSILKLENTGFDLLNAARIWVLFHEIEGGNWGGAGQIYRLDRLMKQQQNPIAQRGFTRSETQILRV